MKVRVIPVYEGFPLIDIKTKKYSICILLWIKGKFKSWNIKKGFYNTTVKMHPMEFTIYY